MSQAASKLIVLAEREFIRGCLAHWLRACCPELDILVAADLTEIPSRGAENPPAFILVYAGGSDQNLTWIEQQILAKGRYDKAAVTILIGNGLDPVLVQDLANRKVIDAIIPASDTTEIAAAALRLVLAGGRYMPQSLRAIPSNEDRPDIILHDLAPVLGRDLTARERAVLELLETGKPNKVIAHKLGMSLSTAKVHVHNIIRKLKVKNRTEAVIAAGRLSMPHHQLIQTTTKVGHLDLEATPGKDGFNIVGRLNRHAVNGPSVRAKAC